MNQNSNQKKLVQAFKTFFKNSIHPYGKTNQTIINSWKYFQILISSDPIHTNKIQQYLQLPKKYKHTPLLQNNSSDYKHLIPNQINHIKYVQTLASSQKNKQININKNLQNRQTDKVQKISRTRKTRRQGIQKPLNKLTSLQLILLKNQQKLQSINFKQTSRSGNRRYI